MYNAGAGGYFDAISAHPYTYPVTPAQSAPTDAWGQLVGMHNTMAAHGDGNKQIWITEFGAPTNGPNIAGDHVSEAVQAQIATEAVTLFRKWNWSGPFFWYDYQDDGTSTADSQNFFGLVRADGSFKPAYYAYKAAIDANSN
jgi:exo-beta-1,3-glucanase (GH17 family)